MEAGVANMEKIMGTKFGDTDEHAAARRRPLRRARFHAGHDGHHPQPRPQRRDRRRAGQRHQERALRLGLLPPLHPDVWRRRHGRAESAAGEDHEPFETVIEHSSTSVITPTSRTPSSTVDDLKELVARFKALVKERTGKAIPEQSLGPAQGRRRRRVRLLDE